MSVQNDKVHLNQHHMLVIHTSICLRRCLEVEGEIKAAQYFFIDFECKI